MGQGVAKEGRGAAAAHVAQVATAGRLGCQTQAGHLRHRGVGQHGEGCTIVRRSVHEPLRYALPRCTGILPLTPSLQGLSPGAIPFPLQ